MEGLFQVYFQLGFQHILDIEGYDHMLFLLALCIPYTIRDWKKVLILATAFTIGHSITLALATLDIVRFPTIWVEFFIPVTILITAILDLKLKDKLGNTLYYFLAMLFGLIHGMGFSNFLRGSMFPGEESRFIWQLLYFNIGIELAQILIITGFLVFLEALARLTVGQAKSPPAPKKKRFSYQTVLSLAVIGWALFMCFERFPS